MPFSDARCAAHDTFQSFNQLDQMTSYTPAGGSAFVLAYNGLGQARRTRAGSTNFINSQLGIQSTSAGTPSYYTHDPDGNLVSLRNPGGGNGGSYYPLTDALGSTVAVTDSSGTVVDAFKYTPYGADAGSTAPVVDPFRFDGGYYGTTMKLYKFGERYSDPSTGRWTQNDPISDPTDLHGWNNYDYAGDNPIDSIDPTGMCWTGLCWASHAYDASTRYLEQHRWARCALFAASAATVAGSYGLAVREAVNAARSGEELGGIIRGVATGTSTKVGTTGGIGVIASQLTGGCLP